MADNKWLHSTTISKQYICRGVLQLHTCEISEKNIISEPIKLNTAHSFFTVPCKQQNSSLYEISFMFQHVLIRQRLFCRRWQFTLRDYFAMSYL